MNRSILKSMIPALIGGGCLLAATSGWSADFTLRAAAFTKEVPLPGGATANVHMWGFALDGGPVTSPGPALVVPPTDTVLNITLQNDLSVPISLVIPNQNGYLRGGPAEHVTFTDPQGRTRARSFVKQTEPSASVTYTWNNVTPGTYLYFSGTHSALQVQMGLYGLLKKDAPALAGQEAYPGVSYGSEVAWIFGEIDFDVHAAVEAGTYGTTIKSMIHSVPEVYLLNGEPLTLGTIPGGLTAPTLVRMLNACYDERIPVVSGHHLELIAEDGRPYPYPRVENAVNLPSLKTRDARLGPLATGASFYDRRTLSLP